MESDKRKKTIQDLRKLLKEITAAKSSQELSSTNDKSSSPSSSKTKTIGANPNTGNFFRGVDDKNGYVNILMLGLITFISECLFIYISYFLFK